MLFPTDGEKCGKFQFVVEIDHKAVILILLCFYVQVSFAINHSSVVKLIQEKRRVQISRQFVYTLEFPVKINVFSKTLSFIKRQTCQLVIDQQALTLEHIPYILE